jgi:hypothetical protein
MRLLVSSSSSGCCCGSCGAACAALLLLLHSTLAKVLLTPRPPPHTYHVSHGPPDNSTIFWPSCSIKKRFYPVVLLLCKTQLSSDPHIGQWFLYHGPYAVQYLISLLLPAEYLPTLMLCNGFYTMALMLCSTYYLFFFLLNEYNYSIS